MERICLVGIKGVGKTTLVKSVIDQIPQFDYLVGSDVLRELVGSDFDHFDKFPDEQKAQFRESMLDFFYKRQTQSHKNLLIDGHTTLYMVHTNQFECVLSPKDCSFYTTFILLEAPANVILERRLKDPSKKRIIDLLIIKRELKAELQEAKNLSKRYGIKLIRIRDGGKHSIQSKFIQILKKINDGAK